MSQITPIALTVTHRGTSYPLSLLPDSTLAALHDQLEDLTSVPPSLQKLLYKGKKPTHGLDATEVTVTQAGLKDGLKVQMLGLTTQELGSLQAVEDGQRKRDRILRERALKTPTYKVRSLPSSHCDGLEEHLRRVGSVDGSIK